MCPHLSFKCICLTEEKTDAWRHSAAVLLERGTLPLTCFTGMAGATEIMTEAPGAGSRTLQAMRAPLLATAFLAMVPVSCCCLQRGPLGCKPLRLAVSPAWAEHQLGPGQHLTPKASAPPPRIVMGTVTWARLACRAAPMLTPPWAAALHHSSQDHPARGGGGGGAALPRHQV